MEKECISDYNNMYTDYKDRIYYYRSDRIGRINHNKISYYKDRLVNYPESISDYKYMSDIGFKNNIDNMNLMSSMLIGYGHIPYSESYDPKLKLSTFSYEERGTIRDQL